MKLGRLRERLCSLEIERDEARPRMIVAEKKCDKHERDIRTMQVSLDSLEAKIR